MALKIVKYSNKKMHYKNGRLHRLEGPAIDYNDGHYTYCVNDKRHRIEGPAIIWNYSKVEYFVNNKSFKKETFEKKYKPCVLKDGVITWQ